MIEYYTDGACAQNGTQDGGWAVVIINGTEESHISGNKKNTTNNEMELKAFLEALKNMANINRYDPNKYFKIYTDSAYIANCFEQSWYKKWEVNGWKNAKKEPIAHKHMWVDIIFIWKNLMEQNKLEVIKVKGHSNSLYNIKADTIAVVEKLKLSEV